MRNPLPRSIGGKRRARRLLAFIAALVLIWLLWGFFYRVFDVELLFCPLHRATGLYCPGCGSMRALASLVGLEFYQALRYNSLFVLSLPFLVIVLCGQGYHYVRDGKIPPPGKWDRLFAVVAIVVAISFGVARNIPALNGLAPTAL